MRPPDKCQDCGVDNPVWFTPSGLWNRVMGGPDARDDPGGLVCPICFMKRAEKAGVVPTAWVLTPELSDGEAG